MCQVHDLTLTCVFEISLLHLFGPRAYITDVPVTYVNAAAVLGAFDVRGFAMKTPMPNLVTEATVPPYWAVLVEMLSVIGSALTAIVLRELHNGPAPGQCFSFLFWCGIHCHFIEGRSLQRGPRSCRATNCPSLIPSTKSWGM
jgi:hypothetical protein